MLIFGKRKERNPYRAPSRDGRGLNTVEEAEAGLDSLDMKIEEKLADIYEESRDGKFKLKRRYRKK
ncbi:MAG: hypothetical protein IJW48_05230 [Clostridia bacterium]|nr:hypothetical protein [Clostridia bacterium]